jgi:hypothetical protein
MRGREDGAAGSVSAPFSLMHRVMGLCTRAVQSEGIVIIFCDWKLLPDISYIASVSGLREHSHLAWIRSRPGGGGLFRGACDPVLIASRTPPDRVDKATVKNWYQHPADSQLHQHAPTVDGDVPRRPLVVAVHPRRFSVAARTGNRPAPGPRPHADHLARILDIIDHQRGQPRKHDSHKPRHVSHGRS